MTTIATDGKSMAADSQCGAECVHAMVTKISRASDGAILGNAGRAFDIAGFLAWYEAGGIGAPDVSDDFEGLALLPNGQILCVDEKGRMFVHTAPAAVGSGCRFAYGAMDAGADPAQAVAVAIKRDAFSGGPIAVEALHAA